jgi:DNA-binding IclR family transcriptional regulator
MRSTMRNAPDDGGRVAGVQSVERAFALLLAFTDDGPSVRSLGELAESSGLAKPTVHRIASTLVAQGALERADSGYRLGLRLFELGGRVQVRRDLREAALPFMEDLYEATHHTVHLAILETSDVVYLERIRGHQPIRLPSEVGARLPAHCTGVGKALLAHSPGALDGRRSLPAQTRRSITALDVLERDLERIRATGVAIDHEEARLGVRCVAAPIFVGSAAVAALSVSGPSDQINVNYLTIAVRAGANGVGRVLASPR